MSGKVRAMPNGDLVRYPDSWTDEEIQKDIDQMFPPVTKEGAGFADFMMDRYEKTGKTKILKRMMEDRKDLEKRGVVGPRKK